MFARGPIFLTHLVSRTACKNTVNCDEEEILQALRIIAQEENMLVEGAAALAMAAYLKMTGCDTGRNNVVLLCGGDFDGSWQVPRRPICKATSDGCLQISQNKPNSAFHAPAAAV